ncbi:MAG: glycosyltransferase family 4 protein, partial [Candidatus Hydrogenedentales bacterium]
VYGYGVEEDVEEFPVHRGWNPPGARKLRAGPSWAKPLQDAALVQSLTRVCREHRVDAAGAHNYEALLVALAARVRPIVYHAHNAMTDELPHYFRHGWPARMVGAWLDRHFPRIADALIVPHARLRNYLVEQGCVPERVHVVPPALDVTPFEPAPVGGPRPVVLYAGNVDAYQNLSLLDDAMARVRSQRPETRLVIATTARNKSGFAGATVEYTPDFADMRMALQRDAVFVCPRTSWSGYPIKLLNAMAAGLPVVCCAGSAYPVVDRQTGLIVADNDAAALADALLQLLKDPARRAAMGVAGRAHVLEHHAPPNIGLQISSVYANVIDGGLVSVKGR